MVENSLIPDTFIVLQDNSDDSNVLMRRWYNANRDSIDAQIASRLAEEEEQQFEDKKK